jgi:hypothetical protein
MPRVIPKREPADVAFASKRAREAQGRTNTFDPYHAQHSPNSRWNPFSGKYEQEARSLEHDVEVPSFWRDLLLEAEAEARELAAMENPRLRGRDQGALDDPASLKAVEEARARLESARDSGRFELRDVAGSGTSFLPPAGAVPGYVAEAFATAARSTSPLTDYLIHRPHPGSLTVTTPRIVSGAAVNVQAAEDAAVQETDPTSALAQVATATIAGQVDLSRQLYDFSNPGADAWVAAELGADFAAKLEVQVISGSGSSGQALGFRNVSGSTAVTHTNGSPTAASNYSKIADLIQQTANASGIRPDTLVLAPRRKAFIESKLGWAPSWFGLNVIESPSMPLTLGAGTNQDTAIVFPHDEVFLYERPVAFRAYPEVGSSTLTVRISALGYAALLANRKPTAIGVSTGTEWVAPTF